MARRGRMLWIAPLLEPWPRDLRAARRRLVASMAAALLIGLGVPVVGALWRFL